MRWNGIEKATKFLDEFYDDMLEDTKEGIADYTEDAHKTIVANAVFTKGYSTGNLRRMIDSNADGLKGTVASPAHYSGYLEYGTRYMEAQPFFFVSFDEMRSLADYILEGG